MSMINYSKRKRKAELTLALMSGVTPTGVTKNINYNGVNEPANTEISINGQLMMTQEIIKDEYGQTTTLLNDGFNRSRVSIRRDPDNYNLVEHFIDTLDED